MALRKKTEQKKVKSKDKGIHGLNGFYDILPKDGEWWKTIMQCGNTVSELHDFHFIETPVLESAVFFEHLAQGISESSGGSYGKDYDVKIFGERALFRYDSTPFVMRSFLEHHLGHFASPLKVFSYGPVFRPLPYAKGEARQFHEWGFSIIGDTDPIYDGETLFVILDFLRALKIKDTVLTIGTLGCKVCRATYREKIKKYYYPIKGKFCTSCTARFEKNPLSLGECTVESCGEFRKESPIILNHLCQGCNNHLRAFLELIEDSGVVYTLNPRFVRNFEYYNKTAFEVSIPSLGLTLCEGGRYDYLAEMIAGRTVPGVGAALFLESCIQAMRAQNIQVVHKNRPRVFFTAVGQEAKKASLRLMGLLRAHGIVVVEAVGKDSLKAQLRIADKGGAPVALLFGQREVFEKSIIIRDTATGAQETILLDRLIEEVRKRLRSSQ